MKKPKAIYEVSIYGNSFTIAATSVGNAVRRCFRSLCIRPKPKSYDMAAYAAHGKPAFSDPPSLRADDMGGWQGVHVKLVA